jgi:hypothetical protein
MKKVKHSIVVSGYLEGKPQYLILRCVYYFGFNLVGEFLGDSPFNSFEEAREYLKTIK